MTDELGTTLREDAAALDAEADELAAVEGDGVLLIRRYLTKERFSQARQDRQQRKEYADRIFHLVAYWLFALVALLGVQGFLGPFGWFDLPDTLLIAIATTTTASVTTLLVIVARYLFPGR